MADNALTRLPVAGQLGVGLVTGALLFGGYYYFVHNDLVTQAEAKSKQLSELQADIRNLEVTANKLQEFQREVQLREAKLETLKRILPADKETPELMKKVQYLAAQSNLLIRNFTPGQTVNKEFPIEGQPSPKPGQQQPKPGQQQQPTEYYQEWPINVDVEGSYHNLGLFFDRVSRLSRLVNVGNVKIKAQNNPKPSNTIAVSCVATTFVYVEATPAPGAPGAKKP
ncbi:MAG TPA: type 4a pilus biogenesis protein PilO [Vicinamibacteria bacterium]|nr:type 4a pilus biogenesis protein PilO [Vicinamibacteria bacterium]